MSSYIDLHNELYDRLTQYCKKESIPLQPIKKHRVGEFIYKYNSAPTGIYFLFSGDIKLEREGKLYSSPIIGVIKPREFFGDAALLTGSYNTEDAIVFKQAEVQLFPKDVVKALLKEDVGFADSIIKICCERINMYKQKIASLITLNGRQKLALFLLGLEHVHDKSPEGKIHIYLLKKDIASLIGITPETVSRYLSDLDKKNYIRLHEKSIEILNRKALITLSRCRF